MHAIGPGVWASVKPLGADLLRMPEKPEGLQVWLLIHNVGTDPTAPTEL